MVAERRRNLDPNLIELRHDQRFNRRRRLRSLFKTLFVKKKYDAVNAPKDSST